MAYNHMLDMARPEQGLQKRQALSERYYLEGIASLALAQEQNYNQPQTLVKACESLIKAIQFGRTNPLPYVAMGYLMILTNDRDRARRYLLEARRVDPQNADAQAYLEYLSRPVAVPKPSSKVESKPVFTAVDPDQIEDGFDYDELYEETESQILNEVRRLMNIKLEPPRAERKQFAQFKASHKELTELLTGFNKQIQILDEEFDTGELQARLRPLEVLLRRLTQTCDVAKRFILLHESILALKKSVDALLSQALSPEGLPESYPEQLEQLLDQTDQLADSLDQLEQEGHDIHPIQPSYEKVVVQIEKLNDVIEDLQEAAV